MNHKEILLDVLKDFSLDRIRQIVLKSEEDDVEYGVRFCKNDKIKATDVCVGDNCNLELKLCPDKKESVGMFHTHPTSEDKNIRVNFLSFEDIRSAIISRSMFTCLGTVQENKPVLKCYYSGYGIDKNLIDEQENISIEALKLTKELGKIKYKTNEEKVTKTVTILEKIIDFKKRNLRAEEKLEAAIRKATIDLAYDPDEGADLVIDL